MLKRFAQTYIQPTLPALARPLLPNAIINAGTQALLHIKKVAEAAAVVGFQLAQIELGMVNGAGAGKGYNAPAVANAVAQFGLGGGVIAVAVTATVVAAHHGIIAQGGHQIKWRLTAQHIGIVNIVSQHQAFGQAYVMAKLEGHQSARVAVAGQQALVGAKAAHKQHAAGGIGIVVAAIEGKAWPQVNAGTARAVLNQRTGIINPRCTGPAKGKIIKPRKEAQVNVLAEALFAAQVKSHPFLANQFAINSVGSAPNAIKREREIDIAHPRHQMQGIFRQPVIGTQADNALPLGGNNAVGEDVGYAGITINRVAVKAVHNGCANLNPRFGRGAKYGQRRNTWLAAGIFLYYHLPQKLGQKFHLPARGSNGEQEEDEAEGFFHLVFST